MIVRTLDQVIGSEREVHAENGNWVSRRFVLDADRAGFSFHETLIFAGTETHICYKNHIEAVYCVGGEGEIEDLATGEIHPIRDGTLYLLNNHDDHLLRAHKELRMMCVFTPPLTGQEVHDQDGVYPPHHASDHYQRARNS